MKKAFFAAFLISAVLTACNDGGGGSSGGNTVFNMDFKPLEAPIDAMSDLDIQNLSQDLTRANRLIPDDEVLLSTVISGSETENIYRHGESWNKAWKKLSREGQNFVHDIQTNCRLENAKSFERDPGFFQGAMKTREVRSSINGRDNCPLDRNRKVIFNQTVTALDDRGQGNGQFSVIQEESNEVADLYRGNLRRQSKINSLSGTSKIHRQATVKVTNGNSEIQSLKAYADGTIKITFNRNNAVSVNIQTELVQRGSIRDSQGLFLIESDKGKIKVVGFEKEVGNSTWYINGKSISKENLSKLLPGLFDFN